MPRPKNRIKEVSLETFYDVALKAAATKTKVICHHTAGPWAKNDQGKASWDMIWGYHVNTRGWCDVGYDVGVSSDGTIWFLRHVDGGVGNIKVRGPLKATGAHCLGHNRTSLGISMIGHFSYEDPHEYAYDTFVDVVAAFCSARGLISKDVYFHRQFANKDCPGYKMHLGEVRTDVARRLDEPIEWDWDYKPSLPRYAVVIGSSIVECGPKIYEDELYVVGKLYAQALGAREVPEGVNVHNSGYCLATELTEALEWTLHYHTLDTETETVHRWYPKNPEWVS